MGRIITQESFIEACKIKHSNFYTYEKTVYVKADAKIIITCPLHGDFTQKATGHKDAGSGCWECAKAGMKGRPSTGQEGFIRSATEVHNGLYNYKKVNYVGSHTHVIIGCKEHGDFEQSPASHLSGKGCSKCGTEIARLSRRKSEEEFISAATDLHHGYYTYCNIDYIDLKTKVSITCPVHGEFFQAPQQHVKGSGCPACAGDQTSQRRLSDTVEFVQKAVALKGDAYDYHLVEYKHCRSKVSIICREHGVFQQTPSAHLAGNECPACVSYGYNTSKPGCVYLLQSGDITKVGITNRTPQVRAKKVSFSSGRAFEAIEAFWFDDGALPRKIELAALRWLRKNYKQPSQQFEGCTECFVDVDRAELVNLIHNEMPKTLTTTKEPNHVV